MELKPCPVCGEKAIRRISHIECDICRLVGPQMRTADEDVEVWNALYYLPAGLPQGPECIGCEDLFRYKLGGVPYWVCKGVDRFGGGKDLGLGLNTSAPAWCPKKAQAKPKCKMPDIGQEWS